MRYLQFYIAILPKTLAQACFCVLSPTLVAPSTTVRFSIPKMRGPCTEGGVRRYWGNPPNRSWSPKLPKIQISSKVTQVETTLGGGQNNSKEHIESNFEVPHRYIITLSKSIFDPQWGDFSKIRLGVEIGLGGHAWRCNMKSDIARVRNLIVSPHSAYNYFLTIPRETKSREISVMGGPNPE